MQLVRVPPTPINGLAEPVITFDQHARLIAQGSMTLGEALALADTLRSLAAAQ